MNAKRRTLELLRRALWTPGLATYVEVAEQRRRDLAYCRASIPVRELGSYRRR